MESESIEDGDNDGSIHEWGFNDNIYEKIPVDRFKVAPRSVETEKNSQATRAAASQNLWLSGGEMTTLTVDCGWHVSLF